MTTLRKNVLQIRLMFIEIVKMEQLLEIVVDKFCCDFVMIGHPHSFCIRCC